MVEELYDNDIRNFTKMIAAIAKEVGYSNSEVEDIVSLNEEAFISVLSTHSSPSLCFEPIANGSFKETYHPMNYQGKFVIKFISEDNETDLEQKILELAEEQEIEQFFVPTRFMDLTYSTLPADLIAEDDSDLSYGDEESPLCMVCVQPFAVPAGERSNAPIGGFYYEPFDKTKENYTKNPLTYNDNEEEVSLDLAWRLRHIINDFGWWQLALDLYGLAAVETLARFIEDNEITDLHEWNYGFMRLNDTTMPVIMDWLSGGC